MTASAAPDATPDAGLSEIAETLRSEAALASRSGQYDRLMSLADQVDRLADHDAQVRADAEKHAAERALAPVLVLADAIDDHPYTPECREDGDHCGQCITVRAIRAAATDGAQGDQCTEDAR